MSSHCNPSVVDDGLVFLYDVEDIQSYKGEPTVNLAGSIVKRFSSWSGLTGTTEYYTTSSGDQGVKLVTTASGGVQWYSFSTIYNIQASTQYTISATVKYTGGTPHPNLLYVRQYDGNGQTSESGKFTTANVRDLGGGWKRIWRTFTTDSTTTHINLQGYEYTTGKTIYIQDLQFELKSHATQFAGVSTTRSSTQGLIDRTGSSTIDISDASFDSNAQMTFDGTDDYLDCGDMGISSSKVTFAAWIKFSGSSTEHIIDASGNTCHLAILSGNKPYFYNGSTYHTGADTITNGVWYYLTGVQSDTNDIYINGVLSNSINSNVNISVSTVNIGRWQSGGRYFNGDIASARIYNRALTAEEVLQNYNATKSRFQ